MSPLGGFVWTGCDLEVGDLAFCVGRRLRVEADHLNSLGQQPDGKCQRRGKAGVVRAGFERKPEKGHSFALEVPQRILDLVKGRGDGFVVDSGDLVQQRKPVSQTRRKPFESLNVLGEAVTAVTES